MISTATKHGNKSAHGSLNTIPPVKDLAHDCFRSGWMVAITLDGGCCILDTRADRICVTRARRYSMTSTRRSRKRVIADFTRRPAGTNTPSLIRIVLLICSFLSCARRSFGSGRGLHAAHFRTIYLKNSSARASTVFHCCCGLISSSTVCTRCHSVRIRGAPFASTPWPIQEVIASPQFTLRLIKSPAMLP